MKYFLLSYTILQQNIFEGAVQWYPYTTETKLVQADTLEDAIKKIEDLYEGKKIANIMDDTL